MNENKYSIKYGYNLFKKDFFQHCFAGATAGAIADICTHPIDTLRTRIQVGKSAGVEISYNGLTEAFIGTLKGEGISGLYKGFGIVLFGTIPAHALYFTGYEFCKSWLNKYHTYYLNEPIIHFLSGFFADICGAIIWVPMDVIKQRLQVQKSFNNLHNKYQNSFHTLKTIYVEEGITGLYKGYGAALATYGPFVGIYFVGYEQSKKFYKYILKKDSDDQLTFLSNLASGAQAGAFAAMVTTPMDVIKTRLQVQSKKITINNNNINTIYSNSFDAIKKIFKQEGIKAFVRGIPVRILWIAPGSAITMAVYEKVKLILKKSS
jgi:hypothetical protein